MKLRNFMNLVRNEHEKMYAKKSIWFCYIFVLAIAFALAAIPVAVEGSDALTRYEYMQNCVGLTGVILMMVVVIGASNISNEFAKGTIKLLLIRPNNRWKVLLSKYVATLVFTFEMLAALFIASIVIGTLFFGTGGSETITIYTLAGTEEVKAWTYLVETYAYGFVELFVMVNFGLMLSSLFRTNAMAIGLTLFFFFAGSMIMGFLFALDLDWGRYILFSNMDLAMYKYGGPMFDGMTFMFSVIVLLVYLAIFTATSWWAFCKRDVLS